MKEVCVGEWVTVDFLLEVTLITNFREWVENLLDELVSETEYSFYVLAYKLASRTETRDKQVISGRNFTGNHCKVCGNLTECGSWNSYSPGNQSNTSEKSDFFLLKGTVC